MEIMSDFDFSKKEVIGHGAFAMVYKGHFRKVGIMFFKR